MRKCTISPLNICTFFETQAGADAVSVSKMSNTLIIIDKKRYKYVFQKFCTPLVRYPRVLSQEADSVLRSSGTLFEYVPIAVVLLLKYGRGLRYVLRTAVQIEKTLNEAILVL